MPQRDGDEDVVHGRGEEGHGFEGEGHDEGGWGELVVDVLWEDVAVVWTMTFCVSFCQEGMANGQGSDGRAYSSMLLVACRFPQS